MMGCGEQHHESCGCPMCTGMMARKKKMLCAMVFFCMLAMVNMFIAGMIHLKLHYKALFKHH